MTENGTKISPKVLDELLKDYDGKNPEDIVGAKGLLKDLTKAVLERAMKGELTNHVGYDKHAPKGRNNQNSRNGTSEKTVQGDFGKMKVSVPRDRDGTFDPKILPKGQRRWTGFDDKIISLYARGLSTREIRGHLQEIYNVEVSIGLISQVTHEVLEAVKVWQNRPLEKVYPLVYFDALFVKCRDHGHIVNKAVYLALGVNMDGDKELLGLWIHTTEGAKFWLQVLTELNNRGVEDMFMVCVDGLSGFPEAIETVFPRTQTQLCIVHQVRHSLKYVAAKDRKAVVRDLQAVYQAANMESAEQALEKFALKWDSKYPTISKSWRTHWQNITVFFGFPQEIRKVVYTTNAIESLNHSLRKVIKTRGVFPCDEAVSKILYLAIQRIAERWSRPVRNWRQALQFFSIIYGDRVPQQYRG